MPPSRPEPPIGDLLGLAIAQPTRALAWADRLVSTESNPWVLSFAHQARGIVLRDRGLVDPALTELRTAVHLARRSGDADRAADARATFGVTLVIAGRTRGGLVELQGALDTAEDPTVTARVLTRRAHALYFALVQPREALVDLERALPRFRATGDRIWEARTLNLMGLSRLALGQTDLAARAVQQAGDIFVQEGQAAETVVTVHNRAVIAWCRGDLPGALLLYDEAAEQFAALGEDHPGLVRDRCEVLLAAGLVAEAVDLASRRILLGSLPGPQEAELLLMLATAELSEGPEAATEDASRARDLFRRQGLDGWGVRRSRRPARPAPDGTAWARAGHERRIGGSAARGRGAGGVLCRLAPGGAAGARRRSPAGGPHACPRGDVPDAGVGSGARHGLAGTGAAVRGGGRQARNARRVPEGARCPRRPPGQPGQLGATRPRHPPRRRAGPPGPPARGGAGSRALLEWSERWRANALFQPPVHPPDDEELARDLAALRDTRRRLADARAEGSAPASRLDEDRARLELAIRRRTHHLRGTSAGSGPFEADRLVEALDGSTFVELVDIDGVLHALVARSGRVSRVVVGPVNEAEQASAFAGFVLRQTARGRPSDLNDVGRRLESALLGDAVRRLGDGPVVLSPTSRLHATPWSLIPALSRVPVSVAPSAALWLRARSAASATSSSRVLVAGPGLESGGGEITVLADRHPDAVLLNEGAATVERTLAAMDGAAIAHIAAHGHFREDSPMFSSLDLDDGPLTVHDFERLERAPHRVVLSACESGVVAPIGAGEMLGLVSAMLAMGSAGIVSSIAKVNDHATAAMMLDVHAAIDAGADLGRVLLHAREAARGDAVREATAAAFLAMGV